MQAPLCGLEPGISDLGRSQEISGPGQKAIFPVVEVAEGVRLVMKSEKATTPARCQRCGSANLESVGSDHGHWHARCVDCSFVFIVDGEGPV
jgi:hypothetical protein